MQELQEALQRARRETEEAIQAGNKKYNDMLADRMRIEDSLNAEIEQVGRKGEAWGAEGGCRRDANR